KLVHWAATARAGELMVKELETPGAPVVALAVDLRDAPDEAVEAAASRAAGLALGALREGMTVVLLTAERGGPRVGKAFTPAEVGRRLAAAVAGPLPPIPPSTGLVVVSASAFRRGRR
ncbi:MAG TPA: DUF58 domain-containing protein, partial [Acidimicrobiales bacterium]|nr:DUF58 domain-containing protein [Acidimicrobiales bacterium]